MIDFQTVAVSLCSSATILGAVVKVLVRAEAKEALNDTVKELKDEDEKLHGRINKNEQDFVTCKFCNSQHKNLDTNIADIKGTVNKIYDWIIARQGN